MIAKRRFCVNCSKPPENANSAPSCKSDAESQCVNLANQIVHELNRAVNGIEDIETTMLFVIERIPVLMLCHKCGPNLFFALTIKLKADPLDCKEIDLSLGDDQLNVDQVVSASVLLRFAARPVSATGPISSSTAVFASQFVCILSSLPESVKR